MSHIYSTRLLGSISGISWWRDRWFVRRPRYMLLSMVASVTSQLTKAISNRLWRNRQLGQAILWHGKCELQYTRWHFLDSDWALTLYSTALYTYSCAGVCTCNFLICSFDYRIVGKLLRENTFANFVDLGSSVKVSPRKKCVGGMGTLCILYCTVQHVHRLWVCLSRYPVCGDSTTVFFAKSHISAIRESFFSKVSCYIPYLLSKIFRVFNFGTSLQIQKSTQNFPELRYYPLLRYTIMPIQMIVRE